MNHSTVQLSCQMAEDISRKSKRLRLLHNQRGSLQKYCETWVEEFEGCTSYLKANGPEVIPGYESFGGSDPIEFSSRIMADRKLKATMPLIVWITIGQILIQLIWEWWKLHHPSQEAV